MNKLFFKKVSRVIEGHDKSFNHVFGGPGNFSGTTPLAGAKPLHHLYTFDTTDPAFPFKIRASRYLPLFYPFLYSKNGCGYRVKSDTMIEILYMASTDLEPNFPYKNYPSDFHKKEVKLVPLSPEQDKTLVRFLETEQAEMDEANGEELDETDTEELDEKERELIFNELAYPFTQLGGVHRMWQDVPTVACPNKACANSRRDDKMEVFAVVWGQPHKGVSFWDDEGEFGEDEQIIFQICLKCCSIHACSRGT